MTTEVKQGVTYDVDPYLFRVQPNFDYFCLIVEACCDQQGGPERCCYQGKCQRWFDSIGTPRGTGDFTDHELALRVKDFNALRTGQAFRYQCRY